MDTNEGDGLRRWQSGGDHRGLGGLAALRYTPGSWGRLDYSRPRRGRVEEGTESALQLEVDSLGNSGIDGAICEAWRGYLR